MRNQIDIIIEQNEIDEKMRAERLRLYEEFNLDFWSYSDSNITSDLMNSLEASYGLLTTELELSDEKWERDAIAKCETRDRSILSNSEIGFLVGEGLIVEGPEFNIGCKVDPEFVTSWEFA